MQTISKRSGRAVVRIGGNSQEKAFFFPEGLANGKTIIKDKSKISNPVRELCLTTILLSLAYFILNPD